MKVLILGDGWLYNTETLGRDRMDSETANEGR